MPIRARLYYIKFYFIVSIIENANLENRIGEATTIAAINATTVAIIIIRKKLQMGFFPPRALLIPAKISIYEATSTSVRNGERNELRAPAVIMLNTKIIICGRKDAVTKFAEDRKCPSPWWNFINALTASGIANASIRLTAKVTKNTSPEPKLIFDEIADVSPAEKAPPALKLTVASIALSITKAGRSIPHIGSVSPY